MENTARNFVLQLGSLIALYITLSALISVMFGVINIKFPDPIEGYWQYEGAEQMIRFGVALLIVFFPTYVVLTRLVNTIRRKEIGTYLMLTKWLVYLSLLVGGGILLGDLVSVIWFYLDGEITTRFLLKAATLLVAIGVAFFYYILDARGYWNSHEKEGIQFAVGAGIIVAIVLGFGFMNSSTPNEVREARLDERQINDLGVMQTRIESYYQLNTALPENIELAFEGIDIPAAPENRPAYKYTYVNPTTFELCATFNSKSQMSQDYSTGYYDGMLIKNAYDWNHGTGLVCFKRSINPIVVK